jgi:hypothetical protein
VSGGGYCGVFAKPSRQQTSSPTATNILNALLHMSNASLFGWAGFVLSIGVPGIRFTQSAQKKYL